MKARKERARHGVGDKDAWIGMTNVVPGLRARGSPARFAARTIHMQRRTDYRSTCAKLALFGLQNDKRSHP